MQVFFQKKIFYFCKKSFAFTNEFTFLNVLMFWSTVNKGALKGLIFVLLNNVINKKYSLIAI